jgi:spore photoproduct lyase
MPYELMEHLEPNTSKLYERLRAVYEFRNAGYEVHLNFSPVIVHDNWLQHYMSLFNTIDRMAKTDGWADDRVKAEVIFLTHNEEKHCYNVANKLPGEEFLWTPKIQEGKISQYGGRNVRYEHNRKSDYIKQFIQIHDSIIPWNTIRYIF